MIFGKKVSTIIYFFTTFLIRKLFRFCLKRIVFIVLISCSLLIFYLFIISYETNTNSIFFDHDVDTRNYFKDYENLRKLKNKFSSRKHKTIIENQRKLKQSDLYDTDFLILEYTKIMGESKYCHRFNYKNKDYLSERNKLYLKECPYKNCIFTCDKKIVNDANALIFSQKDLEKKLKIDKKILPNLLDELIDRERQIWILWNDEANEVSRNLDEFYFNWTISYRIDSEVSDCAYGCKYGIEKKKEQEFISKVRREFLFRKNSAIWFVSNCDPRFRISFAKSLKKHFPVKAFGNCGSLLDYEYFLRIINYIISDRCNPNTECEKEQLLGNKFYLSFESKNCSNYLTEKVWKMLHIGIIPVVIQPSKDFYELNLPPNSFIHAQDFDFNAIKLADYLRFVANDFNTYYSYLKWKLNFQVVFSSDQSEKRRLCELCTRLNTETSLIYYNSISNFFNNECILN